MKSPRPARPSHGPGPGHQLRLVLALAALVAAAAPHATRAQALPESGGAAGAYTPPPCVGLFSDVPCSWSSATWIEQLYRDGVTTGCAAGQYCPGTPVTRQQMAVFLERSMRGTTSWPPNTMLVHAVLASGGSIDQTASGQGLLAAIAAIPTSGAGQPTYWNPWVVVIGPGRFAVSSPVVVPSNVSLLGSGQRATLIFSTSTTQAPSVVVGDQVSLEDLGVSKSVSAGGVSVAIECPAVTAADTAYLDNVMAFAEGGTSANIAINNLGCTLEIQRSFIHGRGASGAPGSGIYNAEGWVQLRETKVYAQGSGATTAGVRNYLNMGETSFNAVSSHIQGDAASVLSSPGAFVRIGASTLDGPVTGGTATCASVWNLSFTLYATTCP